MPSPSPPPSSTVPSKIEWADILNESVHTSDDIDIGDIYAFSRDFIVVKRGIIHKIHYYYIPISKVEGWDRHVLWLKVTEQDVKNHYERDRNPDPLRYSLKDYPAYSGATYPELMIISPKGEKIGYTDTPAPQTKEKEEEERVIYRCDLCDEQFRDEEELSRHVSASHQLVLQQQQQQQCQQPKMISSMRDSLLQVLKTIYNTHMMTKSEPGMSRREANELLSMMGDDEEMRSKLAEVLKAELAGSTNHQRAGAAARDVGRLRR